MTQDGNFKEKSEELRTRAEELLRQKIANVEDISGPLPEDVEKLVHELQVHQIELEMQNEELRQAQLALEESRDRYLDLYDYAPVGYFTLDENALVLEANLTAVRLLGIDRESLIKRPFSRLVCKEDADTLYLQIKRVLESGDEQTCEVKLVKRDGTLFHALLESNSAKDLKGLPTRCHTVLTNITERKRVEAALREKTDGPGAQQQRS